MRIGIDARPLISESPSGIGVYLLEILRNLEKNGNNTYILYTNEPIRNQDPVLARFEKRVVNGKVGTLVICLGLDKALKADKIDEFWGTEHMLPLFAHGVKKILTVHDLALLINPKWGSRKNAIMQNVFCRLSCKCADRIIAVSEATRNDITNLLKINKELITAIPNGGGGNVKLSSEKIEDIEKRIGITGKRFFTYIGNIEPRKNIVGIIKAFEKVNEHLERSCYLVLAGKMGWRTEPIKAAIEQSAYRDYIIIPGYISEDEKKHLMNKAIAFVFPSNYEGFGIPIVEAFSCGGIVITSRNSSLPEVGGKAALYIPQSNDTDALVQRMLECFTMSEQERARRVQLGKEQALQFNWCTCSKETHKVLESM